MTYIFRPRKDISVIIFVTSYILATFISAIFFFSGNPLENLILPVAIMYTIATTFSLAFSTSKVTIREGAISIRTFFLFTQTADIAQIRSLKYLQNYAGLGEGAEITYQERNGANHAMRIGINAYGQQQTKSIVFILQDRNAQIQIDGKLTHMLNRQTPNG
jgi:hypothetical protein